MRGMQDDEAIAFWDEVHAPLGLKRDATPPVRRRRLAWPALLVTAAVTGALAALAPAAWRAAHPGRHPVVVAETMAPAAPGEETRSLAASRRPSSAAMSAEPPSLRRVIEGGPNAPSAAPWRPVSAASADTAPRKVYSARPGPLIINVAEALAAAKLGGDANAMAASESRDPGSSR